MSNRGKHLLEAFKDGPSASPPAGGSSGPAKAPSAPGQLSLFAQRPGVTLRRSQLQLFGLVFVLCVVTAFLVGRASVSTVAAAGTQTGSGTPPAPANTPTPPVQPVPQPAPLAPPSAAPSNATVDPTPRTEIEHALKDPANVYTIKVLESPANDASSGAALEVVKYLRQQGVPAAVFKVGTRVIVLADAKPEKGDLAEMLAAIQKLNGPPPRSKSGAWSDAYVDKIDKFIRRDN